MTNCHLDDSSTTSQEVRTLQELDAEEIFENFKDLVTDLLTYKRQSQKADSKQLGKQAKQLQGQLQKLEGQVRNHIRIEYQLKLHIQNIQTKLDKAQAANQLLKKRLIILEQNQPKMFRSFNGVKEQQKLNLKKKFRAEFESKLSNLREINQKKQKVIQKIECENSQLRADLSAKEHELEHIKKELARKIDRKQANLSLLRKQIEVKSSEINEVQTKVRIGESKIPVKITREKLKKARRSMDEARNTPSPFGVREQPKYRPASRQHIRSISERSRPSSSKRTPSR